jgi:hypothetical protein
VASAHIPMSVFDLVEFQCTLQQAAIFDLLLFHLGLLLTRSRSLAISRPCVQRAQQQVELSESART